MNDCDQRVPPMITINHSINDYDQTFRLESMIKFFEYPSRSLKKLQSIIIIEALTNDHDQTSGRWSRKTLCAMMIETLLNNHDRNTDLQYSHYQNPVQWTWSKFRSMTTINVLSIMIEVLKWSRSHCRWMMTIKLLIRDLDQRFDLWWWSYSTFMSMITIETLTSGHDRNSGHARNFAFQIGEAILAIPWLGY